MVRRLRTGAPGFEAEFERLLHLKREASAEVGDAVAEIIARVREEGDVALCALTERFDRFALTPDRLAIGQSEIEAARAKCPPAEIEALQLAAGRIEAYHRRQLPEDERWTDDAGATLGWRWTPVDAAGLYVPGGTASYPSSVLMNAIPARAAGVGRVVMVVPTPDETLNPLVLAAAGIAGVTEIYRVGGAQAIAALAYGTQTIAPVDKIVGPGNAYVAAAKRQVFGQVGIDSIAGPSEITVVADADNDPDWIAADLLSQSEHDASSQSILITDDPAFADRVAEAAEAQLRASPREEIARRAWEDNSALIVVPGLGDAPRLVDRLAPEHLELAVEDPDAMLTSIRHAGAIFLGRHTPEAVGDYVAGPNHVLPTARAARFSSGLSVLDFLKRTTITGLSEKAVRRIGPAAVTLAEAEGLHSHAQSVKRRLD
ncbi:histidinol dehydrogenase [Parvularcula oceani]|uniref:histidinol dehydrogenase n=1 Tax=Parvularcula oceani TaxID=1247963 RepID=UPI0004E0DC8B|nr:histidinol dehydrogenase [Parvularcula oceani]